MGRSMQEVIVRGQQGQFVAYAKLGKKRIDRAHLDPGSTASVAQLGSLDVILPVRSDEGQCGKSLENVSARTRAGETLKQLLQDKAGCHDDFLALEGIAQFTDLRDRGPLVPSEGERPDAGIDEQRHRRDRSAL